MAKCSSPACPLRLEELTNDALKLMRVDHHDRQRFLAAYFCSPNCAINWLKDAITEHDLWMTEQKKPSKELQYG